MPNKPIGILILLAAILIPQNVLGRGIGMLLYDDEAPAILIQVTTSTRQLFTEGIMLNRSEKTIVRYQLGWLILLPDKKTRVELGEWERVREAEGLAPKAELEVPPQLADFRRIVREERALSVDFFVAGVKFADGTSWEADLKEIAGQRVPSQDSKKEK